MRRIRKFWAALSVISVIVLFLGSASAELVVDSNYQLISKSRASRTEYDYTYQANITNSGPIIEVNVTATLSSSSGNTTIIDGDVSFGNVEAGATVTGSDTFTFRQNRIYAFDPSDLSWDISDDKLRIKNVNPDSALPGQTVILEHSGVIDGAEPIEAILTGQLIGTNYENTNFVSFIVPNGVKSGPLYLKQGERNSNCVYFSISESSYKPASQEDMIKNANGITVASNILLVWLKNDYSSFTEAQRIAGIYSGEAIGKISSTDMYQIQVPVFTLEDLENIAKEIRLDPVVYSVLIDFVPKSNSADWSKDEDFYGQRATNRVEEGAKLYTDNLSPTDSTKKHPIFTSIGIVEDGVDFDAADFDGYSGSGTSRSNNIAIYGNDANSSTSHGTTVTGIIAAELGDGGQKTGKNAGLLQGLENSHGGFNISVKSKSLRANDVIATTLELVKNGAKVINWSFAWRLASAQKRDGSLIICKEPCIIFCEDSCVEACGDNIECRTKCPGFLSEENFNNITQYLTNFIKNEIEKKYPDVVIVVAADNCESWAVYSTPANIQTDSVIVVGAHKDLTWPWPLDSTPELAEFSNIGTQVDITACGKYVKQSDGSKDQGTSFAAPLVTATVAAMQSINPDLTNKEIKHLLRKSALPLDPDVTTWWVDSGVATEKLTQSNGEVREDGKCFYATDKICEGQSARLNVEGAIQAAIDSVGEKTIPIGDKVEVTLPDNTSVSVPVQVTVPEDDVFNKVDIIFMVDVSGSYGDDISQFKSKAVDIVNAFESAGRDVHIGLTTFSDFPFSPYGSNSSGDYAYRLDLPLTNEFSNVISAINGISLHYGMDGPESQLEALYQAATGAGRTVLGRSYADIAPSSVGWRSGSLPIIFLATDYSFHKESSYPGASWSEALSELTSRGIRVYGLQAGGYISDVVNMASATGGESFTLSRNSSEIVEAVLAALESASSKVDIKLVPNGDFADIIQSISPEKHEDVEPGETKTFDVMFTRSLSLDSGVDHVFAFRLEVIAEDVAIIMEIPVTVSIPAE